MFFFLFHQFTLEFTTQQSVRSCFVLSLCKYWNRVTVHRTLRASSDPLYLLQLPPTAPAAAASSANSVGLFFLHFSKHETQGEWLVRLNPLLPFQDIFC